MARPGYMSIYADERTQGIFDEFCRIKGITKSRTNRNARYLYD